MGYKTIATVFRSPESDTAHLDAATALAELWDAHLHVLALGTDRTQPGVYFAGAEAMASHVDSEAERLIGGDAAAEFQQGTDEMIDDFTHSGFEVEGRFLIRRGVRVKGDPTTEPLVKGLIADILPVPGSDRIEFSID